MVPMALAMSLVGGCGGGSSSSAVDASVGEVSDSAARADRGVEASVEGELGADPLDLAGESREAGPDGGGEPGPVDGAISDGAGPETAVPPKNDTAEADRPLSETGASPTPVDATPAVDAGSDAGWTDADEVAPAADVRAPTLDLGGLDAGLDAGGNDAGADAPATDASDASARRPDIRLPDAARIDGPLPRIWVYLMAGQSNMLGQAYTADLAAADAKPIPNAEIYFVSPLETNSHMKAWLPVAPGFGWHDDRFGPEVGFARRYHELYPDRHLALIKVSEGATELFDLWKAPTGALYQLLTQTVLEQLQVLGTRGRPEVAGFLWMQGESDGTVLEHANAYRDNLVTMVEDLRVDLALPTLPVVAGLIATDCCWTYADTIRKGTTQASTLAGNMNVVETDDLPMSKSEIGHYTAAAQIELGSRFANTATALIGTRWKFPDGLGGVQNDDGFAYRGRTGSDEVPMTFDAAKGDWELASGASVGKGGMVPGASQQAELVWTAPFAGTFQITVTATVPDRASSGTRIEISDGARTIWGPWSMEAGRTTMSIFPRDMEPTAQLYFRTSAGPKWDPSHDTTSWQIDIDTKSVSTSWTAPSSQ
jgi:hypothetical protein